MKIGILWSTNSNTSSTLPSGSQSSSMSSLTTPQSSSIPQESSLPLGGSSSLSSIPPLTASSSGTGLLFTTITTAYPTTVTNPSTTFTTFSQTIVTSPISTSTPSLPQSAQSALQTQAVCLGHGLDVSAEGLIATIIIPSVIGLLLWLLFAVLRPRYRQLYALREWFVQQDLRPPPLRSAIWAFLFPPVPMVPSVPTDVSNAGKSAAEDAALFPSDEQLSQRMLWISFLIALGWTILGLAGALPLYLVSTPCLAEYEPQSSFGGAYSTLQDMSLLRLLRLLDSGNTPTTTTTNTLYSRAIVNGNDATHEARIRLIILVVLVIVVGLLPALWKILREFNRLVEYRKRWVEIQCQGQDMGWLSVRKAPGFAGWGEKKLKDFVLKTGLSSSLERNGDKQRRRPPDDAQLSHGEQAKLEVDIQSLFSISDTNTLAFRIDQRDEILEHLEVAETRYISSFRLSTPEPSIADFQPRPPPADLNRPQISRPRALGSQRRRRAYNPAHASSSLAPTSFVAPSQYYKLRGVHGVSGGRFADSTLNVEPSLSDSIHSRVVGTRFKEVNRNSLAFGRLALGSHVAVEKSGELGPIPDLTRWGPNYPSEGTDELGFRSSTRNTNMQDLDNDDWDIIQETPVNFDDYYSGTPRPESGAGMSGMDDLSARRRPPRVAETPSTERRETFPRRNNDNGSSGVPELPPHLRLQPQQPFVRPVSGLDHDDLGSVYNEIRVWRSKLKMINADIARLQRESYNDIAGGVGIRGWLIIGRGLRFIPGIQLIEGRAKEDIRWDVLQHERRAVDSVIVWVLIAVITLLLAAGLTAASGLALARAPDVAHYVTFLRPLADNNSLASGLATTLAPAIGATLFIAAALFIVDWATRVRGDVSISVGELAAFKVTFFILSAVATIWLIAVGSLLFTLRAFDTDSDRTKTIANGSIYMSTLALTLIINVAIIVPGLLLLQPIRLWKVMHQLRGAITPRQQFRAIYPRTYNPSFATGACILAIIFACTFALIFPLIGPAVVVLLFLSLVAHRFLVNYVYARTHSQTGGLLQIWLMRRFATIVSFQPILLGLILLSRRLWVLAGVLIGVGVGVIIFVETFAYLKTRLPGRRSLSNITQNSLDTFARTATPPVHHNVDEEVTSLVSEAHGGRNRGSMASVLEMMSATLAVIPSQPQSRGPVPLQTETLDDLTATERAARTHPDAPPRLPPLSFTDHAEDMAGILYAPELIAPPPIIWLPNDSAGVARSEAYDLQKYHDLQVTLDVRTKEDVLSQGRPPSSRSVRRAS